jgi:N-acetylglutamate synthase-like GNAT family acetyltransferase
MSEQKHSSVSSSGGAVVDESMISVRSYRASDREGVARLYREGSEASLCCGCAVSIEEIEEDFLGRPQDHFWVAEILEDGAEGAHRRIVGGVAMRVEADEVAHLHCLQIAGDVQDEEHLVRRRLVQMGAAHARNHGSLKLVLHAKVVAEKAAAFLHRLGFEFSRHREERDGSAALEFYLNLYQRPELGERGAVVSA